MILVQIIETWWSRQSHGGHEAVVRNAVPQLFRVPGEVASYRCEDAVWLHHAICDEAEGFVPRVDARLKPLTPDLAHAFRLRIGSEASENRIEFFGMGGRHAADTPSDTVLLGPERWLRIVSSEGAPTHEGKWCRRYVYNIAVGPLADMNRLLARSRPVLCINRESLRDQGNPAAILPLTPALHGV